MQNDALYLHRNKGHSRGRCGDWRQRTGRSRGLARRPPPATPLHPPPFHSHTHVFHPASDFHPWSLQSRPPPLQASPPPALYSHSVLIHRDSCPVFICSSPVSSLCSTSAHHPVQHTSPLLRMVLNSLAKVSPRHLHQCIVWTKHLPTLHPLH